MDAAKTSDGRMWLLLEHEEALVFFDVVSRFVEADGASLDVADDADRNVLWEMQTTMEPLVAEIFEPDFAGRLEQARVALREV